MTYIDTSRATAAVKITEENIQNDLLSLLTPLGWTKVCNFKKVAYSNDILKSTFSGASNFDVGFCVAEHWIYKNAGGKMFGLAVVGQWTQTFGSLGAKPIADGEAAFTVWATNQFRKYRSPCTLYFYMLEDTAGLETAGSSDIPFAWDTSDLLRGSLDIEVMATEWVTTGSGASATSTFLLKTVVGNRMQSPVASAGLRTPLLETFQGAYGPVQMTNWWNDSEISLKGWIDDKNIFLIIQADTVPAPEGNLVPSVPFYFGELDPEEAGDITYALFTGSIPQLNTSGSIPAQLDKITHYDYDDPENVNPTILPIIKSYPQNPANGVNSVIVSRGKFGARYQTYYLSIDAPANLMPPARTDGITYNAKDYPRAWMRAENPLYKYNFSPSRYDEKVHTSRVYVVHPEEGVRGALKFCVALPAINVSAQKLRVRKHTCPDDQFDLYRYHLVDGVSPLTKAPAVQFRPMGVGIFEKVVDAAGVTIP